MALPRWSTMVTNFPNTKSANCDVHQHAHSNNVLRMVREGATLLLSDGDVIQFRESLDEIPSSAVLRDVFESLCLTHRSQQQRQAIADALVALGAIPASLSPYDSIHANRTTLFAAESGASASARLLLSLFDPMGRTVLDEGCGNFRDGIAMLEAGAGRACGIDMSHQARMNAREHAFVRGVGARASIHASLSEVNHLKPNLHCSTSLAHLQDDAELRNCARWAAKHLAEDGVYAVAVKCVEDAVPRPRDGDVVMRDGKKAVLQGVVRWLRTEREYAGIFQAAGLSMLDVKRVDDFYDTAKDRVAFDVFLCRNP